MVAVEVKAFNDAHVFYEDGITRGQDEIDLTFRLAVWSTPGSLAAHSLFEERVGHTQLEVLAEVNQHVTAFVSITVAELVDALLIRLLNSHFGVEISQHYLIHLYRIRKPTPLSVLAAGN